MATLSISNGNFEFTKMPCALYMEDQLKKLGIDITNDAYIDNPNFQKLTQASFVLARAMRIGTAQLLMVPDGS